MEEFLIKARQFWETHKIPRDERLNRYMCKFECLGETVESGCSTTIKASFMLNKFINFKVFVYVGDDKDLLEIDRIDYRLYGLLMKTDPDGYLHEYMDREEKHLIDYGGQTLSLYGKKLLDETRNNGFPIESPEAVCFYDMDDVVNASRIEFEITVTNNTDRTIQPNAFIRQLYAPYSERQELLLSMTQCAPEINEKYSLKRWQQIAEKYIRPGKVNTGNDAGTMNAGSLPKHRVHKHMK